MVLVCSYEESKERDEVRGEPEREKGGAGRENKATRSHLLVMLVGGGSSGGAAACRTRRTGED